MRIKLVIPRRPFSELAAFGASIPGTTAKALNDTAFDARKGVVEKLPSHFTIRSTWTEKGMHVQKADKGNLTASVGNRRPYMKVQAEGGDRPDPNGGSQVVPVGARAKRTSRTTPKNWPSAIRAKEGGFSGTVGGIRGIWLKRGKRRKLRLMWRIVEKVVVKKRWPFEEEVRSVVAARWKANCLAALKKARDKARQRRSTG